MTENNKTPLLELKSIRKYYAMDNVADKEVINDLSLTVDAGDFLCILGPSGCGKSTLLKCISGFESFEGSITLDGEPIKKPGPDRILVFQDFNQLFPWKTISKNVQYPLRLQGEKNRAVLKEKAEEYLAKVGLLDYKDYYPHQLSGGMKQRAAIARALVLSPRVMLMDEPFASLDAITRRNLQNELLAATEGVDISVLFVTHNIQEALILGTRTMVMSDQGQIVLDEENTMEKPVKPTSPGYPEVWRRYSEALKASPV